MKKQILMVGIIVLLIVVGLSGCFENVKENQQEYGLVKIVNLKINSTYLEYGQIENVEISVENCTSVEYTVDSFLEKQSLGCGGHTFRENLYSSPVGCYCNDIRWYLFAFRNPDKSIDAEDLCVYIGYPKPSNISSITISNTSLEVYNVTEENLNYSIVELSADIKSNINITNISAVSFLISLSENSCGGEGFFESKEYYLKENDTYYWKGFISREVFYKTDERYNESEFFDFLYCRVFAMDELGNTAISPLLKLDYAYNLT